MSKLLIFFFFFFFFFFYHHTQAYDPLDPNGNITIKWDIISWTDDGYIAMVTINNHQQYRHITAAHQGGGWSLGWTWKGKEVIRDMLGGMATEQGDCSKFKGVTPHSCKKQPTVVDLMSDAPFGKQYTNCCKGGMLTASGVDPNNSAATLEVIVGRAGTSTKTIQLPHSYILKAPGPGYTCGPANIVQPSKFISPDHRRTNQAFMTWSVVCTYSQFLAANTPKCCVALSSFYSKDIVACPTCSCGCQDQSTSCANSSASPLVRCTSHMCPIKIHWHIKYNYKDYWRLKLTITNFNSINYSDWNLVVRHPNLDNLTQVFSFNYKPISPYKSSINDTAMFWGVKSYNDLLLQAGYAQAEFLFRKDRNIFTFESGWAFPRTIYFNGDDCVMPPPDDYPRLPNAGTKHEDHLWMMALLAAGVAMVAFLSWRMCRYVYHDIFIAFISFAVSGGVRIQNLYRRLN